MSSLIHRSSTGPDVVHICSLSGVRDLIDSLDVPMNPVSLYFNFERIKLGVSGKISKIVVFVPPKSTVYVVELQRLGDLAFSVPSGGGRTLKTILESETIPKVFFDVRHASAALFVKYNIILGGVHDVQLMELATRQGDVNKKFVAGWDKCIKKDGSGASNSLEELPISCTPQFNARILHLPVLWATYHARLTGWPEGGTFWVYMVRKAIKHRVSDTQHSSYSEKNVGNALSPGLPTRLRMSRMLGTMMLWTRPDGANPTLTTTHTRCYRYAYGPCYQGLPTALVGSWRIGSGTE